MSAVEGLAVGGVTSFNLVQVEENPGDRDRVFCTCLKTVATRQVAVKHLKSGYSDEELNFKFVFNS